MKQLTEKHKEEFQIQMKGLCNEDLFEELLRLAHGDDYFGYLTLIGRWEFKELKKEFRRRQRAWLLEADAYDAGYSTGYDEGYDEGFKDAEEEFAD